MPILPDEDPSRGNHDPPRGPPRGTPREARAGGRHCSPVDGEDGSVAPRPPRRRGSNAVAPRELPSLQSPQQRPGYSAELPSLPSPQQLPSLPSLQSASRYSWQRFLFMSNEVDKSKTSNQGNPNEGIPSSGDEAAAELGQPSSSSRAVYVFPVLEQRSPRKDPFLLKSIFRL